MCKTVQATPQAGRSTVLESSSSSQGASGLNGAARRDLEFSGGTAGKEAAANNELKRLFTQPRQDACTVSAGRERREFPSSTRLHCMIEYVFKRIHFPAT